MANDSEFKHIERAEPGYYVVGIDDTGAVWRDPITAWGFNSPDLVTYPIAGERDLRTEPDAGVLDPDGRVWQGVHSYASLDEFAAAMRERRAQS
ncbi:MAG TPA: hypothetical protein VF329_15240 [Gammaproteobacteria bacterium]